MSEFLSPEEVAEHIGMGVDFVYRKVLSPAGTLRSYRFGIARRVKRVDLEAWIAEREERDEGGTVHELRSRVG